MEAKDWSLRHQILGMADPASSDANADDSEQGLRWFGGSASFTGLSVGAMQTLVELGFLNLQGNTNLSPTAETFFDFMKRFPMFNAIGYAVHPARPDVRITIEGVEASGVTLDPATIAAFRTLAADADESDIESDYARCWWD